MIRSAFFLLLTLAPAVAHADESRKVWPSITGVADPSVIEMHEPTRPDARATVTFQNEPVHEGHEDFALTYDEVTVEIVLGFNVDEGGSERVTVIPPEGYLAIPPEITVPEHQSDEVHIVRWRGG